MKKIVIIANIDPIKNFGGVEFVCKSIAKKLQNFYDITIVCRGIIESEYFFEKIKIFQIKANSIPVIGDFQYAFKINNIIKHLSPDLIIDNGSLSFLTKSKQIKILSIVHGTNYFNFKSRKISIKNIDKIIYRYFWSIIQKYHLQNVDQVIPVAQKVGYELESNFYRIPKNKIYVIDNGTFIEKNNIIFTNFSNSAIFISNDHNRKGIHIIEKIAEQMPHITFKICGNIYIPKLENIIYLGKLNQQELLENMNKSDFFIFPSIYEGQSLAILDALAYGLPVIISKESDPGIIKDGENGFVIEKQSIDEYINKIKLLYGNIDLYKTIREKNIHLMKNYTWEKQSQKYLELIQNILGK